MNVERVQGWCEQQLAALGLQAPWYVVPAAGGLVLVLVLLVGLKMRRVGRLNDQLPNRKRNGEGRKELVAAQKAEKAGRQFDAAGHYRRAGLVDRAVALYLDAGKPTNAAETLLSADRLGEAAEAFEQGKQWEQAARLYKRVERFDAAGRCYDAIASHIEAAVAWEQAGEWETAGDRYAVANDQGKAARAYEHAGVGEKFVAAFVPWWEKELEAQHGCLEPASYWQPALEHAADAAERLEAWPETLKLGAYLGRWHAAAKAAEAMGHWEEAKRFYHSSKDLEGVARMAEKLGVDQEAQIARGEAAETAGHWFEAARHFEQAGAYDRALPLYMQAEHWHEAAVLAEQLQQFEDAASAWGKAGEHRKVADIYFKLERWDPAGAAYEAAGEMELAADAYRKAENWVAAARVWETVGNTQNAIQDLQQQLRKVGQDRGLSLKLVELMMVEGMRGTALGILEPMVTMQPGSEEEAGILYNYGMLLEDEGRNAEAATAYERLLAYDVAYRDARARAERVRNLPERTTNSGSSAGEAAENNAIRDPLAAVSGFQPAVGGAAGGGEDAGGVTQEILDRYVPKGELGRGGMGVVVKAHDKMLDRMVAIKLVKTPSIDTGQLDKILNEARATAKLNHPNIVQIYDCALAQGNFLMAMEYVEGQSVKDLIQTQGPLPVPALVLIFGQIAKALKYAHDNGIVHRDIKPANILWTEDKQVKIADFGLARAAQELANTQTVVVGSPYYMAPEQLMGNRMDHRVDIYALGVSLFEAATGQLPFPKGDVGYHHVHSEAPDPSGLRGDLPVALVQLIRAMLAKDPDARPADCGEVLESLKAIARK